MCMELPGRVVEVPPGRPDVARIDVSGVVRSIHLGLLDGGPPKPGEWVSIHLGFAIARLTDAEAAEATAFAEGFDREGSITELFEASFGEEAISAPAYGERSS